MEIYSTQMGFQIDTSKIALSANQIEAEQVLANQRTGSEHHLGNCQSNRYLNIIKLISALVSKQTHLIC